MQAALRARLVDERPKEVSKVLVQRSRKEVRRGKGLGLKVK